MKNYWTMHKDAVVSWLISFPTEVWRDVRRIGRMAATLLEAGEATEVFRVVTMPAPYTFNADKDGSYAAYVARTMAHEQTLPMHFSQQEAQVQGRIAYLGTDGAVFDAEVADLSALLRELRPEVAARPRLMQAAAPVAIEFGTVDLRQVPPDAGDRWYIGISLFTDIWFPWVRGGLEPDVENEAGERLLVCYDNRLLASRHTPRLNQFLTAIRTQAREIGGIVEIDAPEGFYAGQIGETGVLLEAAPPRPVYPR